MVPKNKIQMFVLANYLIMSFIVFASCNTAEPPVPPITPQPKTILTTEDVSCLEAWINLEIENIDLPVNVSLLKDSTTVFQINNLTSNDTILYIDSLLPSQTYKFQSIIQQINQSIEVKSNELQVTTLTPTSQSFTWQTYNWGMHSSSEINDISIIDENNIWAVGEIYMNDSLGNPEPSSYNVAHWNGQKWELKKILFYTICGQQSRTSYPAKAIFTFNENEIWIAMDGDQITKLENGSQVFTFCLPWSFSINKLWGNNSNDLYVVGNEGNIAWYNGTNWQKIETGTDINFRDIYGSINKDNNELEIIALASNSSINQRKKLVRIKDQTIETLPDSGLANYLSTVWFISGKKYCIGGQGYYESNTFGPVWERNNTIPQFHITSIRGAGLSDIVIGGSFGLLMHFNGVSWMNYAYITASYFDVVSSVAIKGNTIVAAGFKGSKAVVMIGKR